MKIGFLLPANFAVGNPGNGVRAQARYQAEALERLGHGVTRLDPWDTHELSRFDVIHFFLGGFANLWIEQVKRRLSKGILVFAPTIDTNEPNWRYRLAVHAGHLHEKLYTIPGALRDQAMGSDLVVCRSEHERDRVVKGLGIEVGKTAIVLNGADVVEAVDGNAVRRELGFPEGFVLHVSAYTQQRKNVVRLVEAVGALGYPLVIAGHAERGSVYDRLQQRVHSFGNIRLYNFLDKVALHRLYAGCRVFCLPSVFEGTGLAALEAASYGAKVVITQNGGARDYFAEHAEYVDPYDTSTIREALKRAWDKPESLLLRDHLRRNLTWDHSAQQLVVAYERRLRST